MIQWCCKIRDVLKMSGFICMVLLILDFDHNLVKVPSLLGESFGG